MDEKICNTCGNKFVFTDKTPVLEAILMDKVKYFAYCSEECMNKKFENISSSNSKFDMDVELLEKKRTSISPNRWKAVFRAKNLKNEV